MKYALLLICTLVFASSCDDDDPNDVVDNCSREAAFRVDELGVCAFGSSTTSAMGARIELEGLDGERLTIQSRATETGTFDIPSGSGVYVDNMNVSYLSTDGSITFDELGGTADGSFFFNAVSADGVTVSVTQGVFEDL